MDRDDRGLWPRRAVEKGAVHGRSTNGLRRLPSSLFLSRFRRTVDRVDRFHPVGLHLQTSSHAMADANHAPRAFVVPQVEDNAEGWGPCSVPAHLKDLPYAPFNKADKIGRAADFSGATYGKAHYGASWTRKRTKRSGKRRKARCTWLTRASERRRTRQDGTKPIETHPRRRCSTSATKTEKIPTSLSTTNPSPDNGSDRPEGSNRGSRGEIAILGETLDLNVKVWPTTPKIDRRGHVVATSSDSEDGIEMPER